MHWNAGFEPAGVAPFRRRVEDVAAGCRHTGRQGCRRSGAAVTPRMSIAPMNGVSGNAGNWCRSIRDCRESRHGRFDEVLRLC